MDPFDELLDWLAPDRETAARKYETIRAGLIQVFRCKGLCDAEDLADTAINRVMAQVPRIRDSYVGDPAKYFYGVARYIIRETRRRKEIVVDMGLFAATQEEISEEAECLNACLKLLTEEQRELILEYYLYSGPDKIAHRKKLAERTGTNLRTLRVQAHRIRKNLQNCVLKHLGKSPDAMNNASANITNEDTRHG